MSAAALLEETAHRPWPLPERRWVMAQRWEQLLFAHWPVDPELLARVVPPQIPLDTFDGHAWIGVTPFRIGVIRPRGLPHVPPFTRFPELNVRTYATIDGRPGIWFLSLDTSSLLSVLGARRVYRLPYFRARMSVRDGDWVTYRSRRVSPDGPAAAFAARYRATGGSFTAAPGSLDHFLTERYCLYTLDRRRRVHRADIHHPPWPLQPAVAEIEHNSMALPFGVDLTGAPLLHFAGRQDMVAWLPVPVAS